MEERGEYEERKKDESTIKGVGNERKEGNCDAFHTI